MLKLHGIRWRLWLATALPALLMIAMMVIGLNTQYAERMSDALQDRGLASARQLAGAAEFMLFADDSDGLLRLAESAMRGDQQLRGVTIVDRDGRQKAQAGSAIQPMPRLGGRPETIMGEHLLVVQPILPSSHHIADPYSPITPATLRTTSQDARPMGYAVLELSMTSLSEQRRALLWWSLLAAAGGLVLAGLMAALISSQVTAQIVRINRVVNRVGKGQLDARIDVARSGMLGPLAQGINAMAARIAHAQEDLQRQIDEATLELRKQKDAAERTARTDALTGAASRLAFVECANTEMERARRYGGQLSLLMLDLDHFKDINDTHGHAVGDAALVHFAHTVLEQVRKVDLVARLGGEEFAVLLPAVSAEHALSLAERICQQVRQSPIDVDGQALHFTVSIGVAPFHPESTDLAAWLARADMALYQAKADGRNRVKLAPDGDAQRRMA